MGVKSPHEGITMWLLWTWFECVASCQVSIEWLCSFLFLWSSKGMKDVHVVVQLWSVWDHWCRGGSPCGPQHCAGCGALSEIPSCWQRKNAILNTILASRMNKMTWMPEWPWRRVFLRVQCNVIARKASQPTLSASPPAGWFLVTSRLLTPLQAGSS